MAKENVIQMNMLQVRRPEFGLEQNFTKYYADGNAVLSGQVPRSDRFRPAAGGGKPNPGLLTIQFRAGSLPGLYRTTVELLKGNSYQFTVEAR